MRVSTSHLQLDTANEWTAFYIPIGGRIIRLTYNPTGLSEYKVEHERDPEPDPEGYLLMDKHLIKGNYEDVQNVGGFPVISTDGETFWVMRIGTVPLKPQNVTGEPSLVEPDVNAYFIHS